MTTRHPLDGPYETLPVVRMRKLYAGVRDRALARMSREEFDRQVHQFLGEHGTPATPADWIMAAVRVRHDCGKCHCTGSVCLTCIGLGRFQGTVGRVQLLPCRVVRVKEVK